MNAPVNVGVPERTSDGEAVYRQIRSEIQFELGLVNARVNWLIASQAFLFTPLTMGAQGGSLDNSPMYPMIPIVGLALCLLVAISVAAAIWRGVEWRIKASHGPYSGKTDRDSFSAVVPHTPWIPWMGAVGAVGVPVVLIAAWTYLLFWPPG